MQSLQLRLCHCPTLRYACCRTPAAVALLTMRCVQDVVFLAGFKALRQGTSNITLTANDDGLWPALKAKVARVLHERASAVVNGDEEKVEYPRDMRYAGLVEETYSLRASNSVVAEQWLKCLRVACRAHTPGVVFAPFKEVTQLWWAPGDDGVPALVGAALSRIESAFLDVGGLPLCARVWEPSLTQRRVRDTDTGLVSSSWGQQGSEQACGAVRC